MRPSLLYGKKQTKRASKNTLEYRAAARAAQKLAREQWVGSQGAASAVRKIDPVTGEVIPVIDQDANP